MEDLILIVLALVETVDIAILFAALITYLVDGDSPFWKEFWCRKIL